MMTKRQHCCSLLSLPDDIIITNIFLLLPVKSIYRFRSVSKTWLSLFSSPNFIQLYNSHAIQENKFSLIINQGKTLNTIDYDSLSSNQSLDIIDYPFIYFEPQVCLVGSCYGLVSYVSNGGKVYLFNPSTYEYRVLPSAPPYFDSKSTLFVSSAGFGYDRKRDDYKFLSIASMSDGRDQVITKGMLYTSGPDSWKPIENIPYKIVGNRPGVLVNGGALHWIATPQKRNETSNVILSFNMVDNRIKELALPEQLRPKSLSASIIFGLLREHLCIFDTTSSMVHTQVWTMKEERGGGVSASWTKLFTITLNNVTQPNRFMRPVHCFNNGYVLLEKDLEDLILYDQNQKKTTIPKLSGLRRKFNVVTCVRSLVSLNSGTYLKQEFHKKVEQEKGESLQR